MIKLNTVSMKNAVLAVWATAGAMLAKMMGGWDAAMKVLVFAMAADYLTGVLVAAVWQKSNKSENGALDSKAGFKGLCKKGMIFLLIWLGVLLDEALGEDYIRTAIILFFMGNEGISLLENLGIMGVPFPNFLKRALEALREEGNGGKETGEK